jgi:hypothetical protein
MITFGELEGNKDVKVVAYSEVLSQDSLGETEKPRKVSVRVVGVSPEVRAGYTSNVTRATLLLVLPSLMAANIIL